MLCEIKKKRNRSPCPQIFKMWLKRVNSCSENKFRTVKLSHREIKCVEQLITIIGKSFHYIIIKLLKNKTTEKQEKKDHLRGTNI